MLRKMKAGSTSQSIPFFVADTSSTTGAGLGSLVYNSSGLAAKYRRQGQSSWTTITLATMTAGTWASGGFVSDGGPVTGGYELGIPDAALAAGVEWVEIAVYGATNMLAVLIFIELDVVNYQSLTAFVTSVVAASIASGGITSASFAAGAIDNAAIATDAIGSAELASTAIAEIQSGLALGDGSGRVTVAPAGLDAITITDVSSDSDARSTFPKMIRGLFNRLYNKVTQTATQQIVYNDSNTAISTQTTSDDGTTATKGKSA